MMRGARFVRSTWFPPAAVACAALVAVLLALDPTGDHPGGWDGPGLTVDESFNVIQGVRLVDRLLAGDWAGFRAVDAQLADHPPLGRVWNGLCHELAFTVFPPTGTSAPYSYTCARLGPALAFGGTVFLVGWFTARWHGTFAGGVAAASVALMPRTFGHAHLAALESGINLAYTSAVLYLADRWGSVGWAVPAEAGAGLGKHPLHGSGEIARAFPPAWSSAIVGGLLFGMALLTKIQAVFLPIPIALWALFLWRKRAIGMILIWGVVGLLVFFAGWPYLRDDPAAHLLRYLGRTTERSVVYVWYGGQSIADREVPWHYPWALWGTTIPVGLLVLGALGMWSGLRERGCQARAALVLATLVFPLLVFSIPGIAVYDGERLFSVSYPLWGVLAGMGAGALREWLAKRVSTRAASVVLLTLVAVQGVGIVSTAPCWLSYYNALAGGLAGAERHGLAVSYWGDGVLRELLDEVAKRVPEQGTVAVAPVLHKEQWNEIARHSPALSQREIRMVPYGSPDAAECEWLLYFSRLEYLPEELRGSPSAERMVAVVRREGIVLATLVRVR